ncbi:MAG: NAD(P)/FAD-dependent oxidoreductase, partial [Lachnospiraceae bacterium]|nr:NAD(P)/FAD-dependent oxidoreductase [Lachnospiraceae bacterium]
MKYDVAVIGAGVVGAMMARTLARYELKVCILEKECDVAMGATRANSAIVHAGFDAHEGSLKAKLNVQGSEMFEQITKELGVKYIRNGSLVVGFNDDDRAVLEDLKKRGIANGVKGLRIVEKEELHRMEPGLSENITMALWAPTGAITCPYELTIAAVGNAMDNGVELKLNYGVTSIEKKEDGFVLSDGNEEIEAKYVINCAGVYSDEVARMVGDDSFTVHPRRGEYILLDKEVGNIVKSTIFRTPTKMGKGILISPTVDGNLITGPTATDQTDKEDKDTTDEGLSFIMKQATEDSPLVRYNRSITSFTGLRAVGSTGDFIITSPVEGFVNAAGIESPGLSSAPAIALYILDMLKAQGITLAEKADFNPVRKSMTWFRDASIEEKNEAIKKDPSYGRVICRCETVTEGEILEAIRTNPKATDLDGVKRRTRAQMGRCQGG